MFSRTTPRRLTLLLAVAMLAPLVLLAFGTIEVAGDALRSQAQLRLSNTAAATASFVQEHLTGFDDVLQAYALRRSTAEAFLDAAGPAASERLNESLQQLQRSVPGVVVTFAADPAGKLLAIAPSTPEVVGTSYVHRDWYRGVLATGRPYVSELYVTDARGHPRVTAMAVPVRDGLHEGKLVGILALAYDTAYIRRFADDFAQVQGVRVTITDQRGALVTGAGAAPLDLASHANEPGIALALRGRASMGEVDGATGRELSAYAPVPKVGWTVACALPASQAYAPLVRLRRTMLGIAAVLALVLAGVLSVLYAAFSNRQRDAQRLRENQARTALILEAATDAFLTVDARGRVAAWNSQAEKIFGWRRDEALGRDAVELILPPRLRERLRGQLAEMIHRRPELANRRAELHAVDRAGREFPIEAAVWSSTVNGAPELHAFVHDISERRRAELELAAARDAATEALHLKSSFLANMSHEIRTPMNGIIGISELVLRGELSAPQRESVELILSSATTLLRVINDILDFSKIEAGRLELDPAPFELRAFLRGALRPLALTAGEKGLALDLEVAPGVPDVLVADFARIGQVLVNLVGNAIKFTPHGRVEVNVSLAPDGGRPSENKAVVRFAVADTGIGIPADKQQTIFEPFQQADASTTRRYGGTGLGLTISARFVAMMGGALRVESEPGKGSRFFFELPVGLATLPEPKPSRPAARRIPGRLRVLLAEDNAVNRRVATALLEQQGHEVIPAADGQAALERFVAGGIDLVLMDVQMPKLDGLEATAAIRRHEQEHGGHVPIIGVTAHAMVGDRERCLAAGMDGYVAKPVRAEPLLEAIELALGRPAPSAERSADRAQGVLDEAALLALIGGDRALLRELAALFAADSPALLEKLRSAAGSGDAQLARRAAHTLKGSAGSLCAARTMAAAQRLEELATAGDAEGLRAALPALEAALRELSQALAALAA